MHEERMEECLRVCFFGTYRQSYTRNQIILQGLRAQGVDVVECHSKLWQGIEDRVQQASGGWRRPRFWKRVLSAYWRLLTNYLKVGDYDVMLVGYPGQFDSYLAWVLTRLRRKPLVLDVLMSLHLVAEERGLTERSPRTGRLIFLLEKGGLKRPDLLIAENGAYAAYLSEKYDIAPERFCFVPHGANDEVYKSRPHLTPPSDVFRILYHGTYVPSHGLDVVIDAAEQLREHEHIEFHFFGEGQERPAVQSRVRDLGLENVHFHGWVEMDALLDQLAQAHLCLGVFGTTRQSYFTIQNKVWEGMAMARPVVTGDSETIRAALRHKEHVYLVERENPQALAAAILELEADADLRERMAQAGYERVKAGNSIVAIGDAMKQALLGIV